MESSNSPQKKNKINFSKKRFDFGFSTRWNEKKKIIGRRSSFAFRAPYLILLKNSVKYLKKKDEAF